MPRWKTSRITVASLGTHLSALARAALRPRQRILTAFLIFSPWRILDDCGAAFAMGAVGSSIFHAYKGAKNSPRVRLIFLLLSLPFVPRVPCALHVLFSPSTSTDRVFYGLHMQGERLRGSLAAIKTRSPVTGGGFAVWGGTFSAFDCTFAYIRGKDDPWNGIMSGFATGGALALRAGPRTAAQSAVIGGVLLAIIEGISIGLNRLVAEQYRPVAPELPETQHLPPTQLPREPQKKLEEFVSGAHFYPRRCEC